MIDFWYTHFINFLSLSLLEGDWRLRILVPVPFVLNFFDRIRMHELDMLLSKLILQFRIFLSILMLQLIISFLLCNSLIGSLFSFIIWEHLRIPFPSGTTLYFRFNFSFPLLLYFDCLSWDLIWILLWSFHVCIILCDLFIPTLLFVGVSVWLLRVLLLWKLVFWRSLFWGVSIWLECILFFAYVISKRPLLWSVKIRFQALLFLS